MGKEHKMMITSLSFDNNIQVTNWRHRHRCRNSEKATYQKNGRKVSTSFPYFSFSLVCGGGWCLVPTCSTQLSIPQHYGLDTWEMF